MFSEVKIIYIFAPENESEFYGNNLCEKRHRFTNRLYVRR